MLQSMCNRCVCCITEWSKETRFWANSIYFKEWKNQGIIYLLLNLHHLLTTYFKYSLLINFSTHSRSPSFFCVPSLDHSNDALTHHLINLHVFVLTVNKTNDALVGITRGMLHHVYILPKSKEPVARCVSSTHCDCVCWCERRVTHSLIHANTRLASQVDVFEMDSRHIDYEEKKKKSLKKYLLFLNKVSTY